MMGLRKNQAVMKFSRKGKTMRKKRESREGTAYLLLIIFVALILLLSLIFNMLEKVKQRKEM